MIITNKTSTVILEDFKIGNEFLLEMFLNCQEQDLDIHGLALKLKPIVF